MNPTPREVAIELAGGLLDRRVLKVWSAFSPKRLLEIVLARKIMREHHKNRSKRFAILCDDHQRGECERLSKCFKSDLHRGSLATCKCYELGQSYTVMELGDDRS